VTRRIAIGVAVLGLVAGCGEVPEGPPGADATRGDAAPRAAESRAAVTPAEPEAPAAASKAAARRRAVVIEFSKPMRGGRGLGTMGYPATEKESAFLEGMEKEDLNLWAGTKLPDFAGPGDLPPELKPDPEKEKEDLRKLKEYTLSRQAGKRVGWFGIVREIEMDEENDLTRLLLEHKYFDGMTDLHIQVVSYYGAGDFVAVLPSRVTNLRRLSLVRVYGNATVGNDGLPCVAAEYVRVWDWGLFTFMNYGQDKTNATWVKLRKVKGEDCYSPRPDRAFYEQRLGTR